ncbi:Por secretion system C-terminal sorting domain-containing protein [Lutibacter oricola]|uniref:Por secretion system C-terminal sorting domain-containing protein n=1 Tax=Lutibacter oricola TaxID=762486 RepID=A0A1H2S8W2_9FLAO|nr:T9SS type A sorting domain-containing protein [Lutibacter oricola]SDW28026.1 Por secretion system C-terminal sorting domain-containing protein [Lutibacter oricola]
MKTTLLKNLLIAVAFFCGGQLFAQVTYTFDSDEEGWTAGGNAPNLFATSITSDPGSGANTGLVVLAPKEDTDTPAPGTTLTQNTIMYAPTNAANGGSGINADAYNAFTIILKNQTAGTILRIRCNPGSGWVQQDFTITANDTEFKTYSFPLSSTQWSGTSSDISVVIRDTSGALTSDTKVLIDSLEFFTISNSYSEFTVNPGFEDAPFLTSWSPQVKPYGTVGLSTTETRTGSNSLKIELTTDGGTAGWWAINAEPKVYGETHTEGTVVTTTIQVKTNVASDYKVFVAFIGEGNTSYGGAIKEVLAAEATDWKELTWTYTLGAGESFTQLHTRISLPMAQNDFVTGNMIFVDDIVSTLTPPVAGIEDYQQLKGVNIYPNPANNILNINCPEGSKIEVYNLLGTKLKLVENASKEYNMNILDLATGLYIVKVESEGKFYSKRIHIN